MIRVACWLGEELLGAVLVAVAASVAEQAAKTWAERFFEPAPVRAKAKRRRSRK